jgi:pantetheine-phosphate adenylyltransferase
MKKVGIYAGSFNPFHVGHADILRQAQRVFDEVIVAVGTNVEKEFIEKEPFPFNHPIFKNVCVNIYHGLFTDYLNNLEFNLEINFGEDKQFFFVRGLRNGDDMQYEQNQLAFMQEMCRHNIKPVFFITDRKYEHISSNALRALKKMSPQEYLKYVILPVPEPEPPKYGE